MYGININSKSKMPAWYKNKKLIEIVIYDDGNRKLNTTVNM